MLRAKFSIKKVLFIFFHKMHSVSSTKCQRRRPFCSYACMQNNVGTRNMYTVNEVKTGMYILEENFIRILFMRHVCIITGGPPLPVWKIGEGVQNWQKSVFCLYCWDFWFFWGYTFVKNVWDDISYNKALTFFDRTWGLPVTECWRWPFFLTSESYQLSYPNQLVTPCVW